MHRYRSYKCLKLQQAWSYLRQIWGNYYENDETSRSSWIINKTFGL